MFIDPTQKILDLDGNHIMIDQSHDLAPKGIVVVIDGKELHLQDSQNLEGRIVVVDGKPRMKGGKPMTFGHVACTLLCAAFKGEEELPLDEKLKRGMLGLKLKEASMPVEIGVDDLSLIKKLAGKGCDIPTLTRIAAICDNPIVALALQLKTASSRNGKAMGVGAHKSANYPADTGI